ncbi:hypothetical protein [Rhizobium anhuiense]|uniref:Uncharacterized protein n=1 Tax=Rhizobium anhuiense TaxID=1184720 RepID=A0A3S0XNQ6_9HYPH|nr:hypothetical protein [Rhizobium anhuiense]RUM02431.1 hypothetical protein EEQ99_11885 [Rhizobium anhuiense]GGD78829.1 hypothetical protein GCM10008012_23230 [Rhizobium anhuiense]
MTDKAAIELALATLDISIDELPVNAIKVAQATDVLQTRGQRLTDFFSRHGEKFAESFADQLGKRAADSITLATWLKFAGLLTGVYQIAKMLFAKMGASWPL